MGVPAASNYLKNLPMKFLSADSNCRMPSIVLQAPSAFATARALGACSPRDLIQRDESFRVAVITAFAPFYNARMYGRAATCRGLEFVPAQSGETRVDIVKGNMGWIEVVVGPMFSGKSEELIRRLRRAEIARQRVQIFKPAIDERYAANEIVSHSGLGISSDNVTQSLRNHGETFAAH